jgi:hypothetical protein
MKWLTDILTKNRKTSTAGALAGIPVIIQGVTNRDWAMALAGLGMVLTGLFASDVKDAEKPEA